MKFLIRIFFGADFSFGILIFLFLSYLLGSSFSVAGLLLAIWWAHAPDIDMIPYLALRKRQRLKSHRVVGHHPLIYIPITVILGMWLGEMVGVSASYGATCAFAGGMLHFIHDSMCPQGLHWGSPFTWTSISIQPSLRIVPWTRVEEIVCHAALQRASHGGEITSRIGRLERWEIALAGISWTALLFFSITKS